MRSCHRFSTWFLAIACAGWALPASAAEWEKYLLDDTNFILSVNVRQVLQSPLFMKHFQRQFEELLKTEGAQAVLKDTGVNPFQDIESLVVVMGKSSLPGEGVKEAADALSRGPLIVVHGRFDADKVQARIEQAAKDMPEVIKIRGIGKANVAEFTAPLTVPEIKYFAVVLDKTTLVLAPRRGQIEDVLEKAAGDRKTELKDPVLRQLMKALDLKQAINVAATSDAVVNSRYSSMTQNEKKTVTVKHERFGDFGIEALTGKGSVDNDIRGKVTLATKDAESAKKLNGMLEQTLSQIKEEGERQIVREKHHEKEIAALLEAIKTVRVSAKGREVTLEGHAGAAAVQAVIKHDFP